MPANLQGCCSLYLAFHRFRLNRLFLNFCVQTLKYLLVNSVTLFSGRKQTNGGLARALKVAVQLWCGSVCDTSSKFVVSVRAPLCMLSSMKKKLLSFLCLSLMVSSSYSMGSCHYVNRNCTAQFLAKGFAEILAIIY